MSNKKRWLAMKCQKQDDKNLMISGIAEPLMAGQGGSAQLLFMSLPEKAVKLRDRWLDGSEDLSYFLFLFHTHVV